MKLLRSAGLIAALSASTFAWADDTDIFSRDPNVVSGLPNVLFVIDNGASWESNLGAQKKKDLVHEALYRVLGHADFTDQVRVGLMPFSDGNQKKGGVVFSAVNTLDATYQDALKFKIYDDGTLAGEPTLVKTNNSPYALTLNEAYRYYAGLTPRSGLLGTKVPYDPSAIAGGYYVSPANHNICANNYIIVIGTGDPDNGENTEANNVLAADTDLIGPLPSDPIKLTDDQYQASWADEYARAIAGMDVNQDLNARQSVYTYVIDVHEPEENPNNKYLGARAFFKSIAKQGKGLYFTASNSEEIVAAVTNILNEIQAVNSVFASVSLPVSVNVQGTNLNQVYVGVFRPDAQNRPRWFGNLKRYQYQFTNDQPYLADLNGDAALNPSTGFITQTATSWWTSDSNYWAFSPRGTPESASDAPDGEVVEKGAVAQGLRSRTSDSRKLYTCTGSCTANSKLSNNLFATTNANITAAALGAADDTQRKAIIQWVRGVDNQEPSESDGTSLVRPSLHGDVLHSRPAVVNYGNDTVVVFYGANDGVFRAVDGTTGEEKWGFIPTEFFPKLKALYDNNTIDASNPKPYFVDGNIEVYQQVVDGVPKVYLYASLRRGGNFIFALDVSDPNDPRFLWQIGAGDSEFAELGQTWSMPKLAKVAAYDNPVLFFGGGYDPGADDVLPAGTATRGRDIFMVDALDGSFVWKASSVASFDYSIPSEVALVNSDLDSQHYADALYVGDTGGNVWRADIHDATLANWSVTKLAAVGGAGADARKFLYPPDIVFNDNPSYTAVLIGSGDREHPFETTVANRFYMFKDTHSATTITEGTDGGLLDVTDMPSEVDSDILAQRQGWFFRLGGGEKTVSHAVTLAGATYFYTNTPASPNTDEAGNIISCDSNLGTAREYVVSYLDGTVLREFGNSREEELAGGGFPPPPGTMTLNDETYKSGLDPKKPPATTSGMRKSFWFKEMD